MDPLTDYSLVWKLTPLRMLRIAILLSAALLSSAFVPAKLAYRPTNVRLLDSSSSLTLKEKISAFKSCSNATRTDINEMVLQVN